MRFILLMIAAVVAMSGPVRSLESVQVANGIYAILGPHEQRSAQNLANNATFGLIVTEAGCVLVDPGGSYQGAAALDAEIRKLTDRKVEYVIDTGGQDHRWLGNGYWREKGAKIIAAKAAVEDQKARASLQLTMLGQLMGDAALKGTEPAYADIVFDSEHKLAFGGLDILIRNPGTAHTPGDSFVWLASKSVVFAGDIVFTERMLGVLPFSKSKGWMAAFEAVEALQPAHVVPGHGKPTTLAVAKADTYDYLAQLREKVGAHIEAGGALVDVATTVDQSAFARLEQYDALKGRNAEAVFAEMEFE